MQSLKIKVWEQIASKIHSILTDLDKKLPVGTGAVDKIN